MKMKINENYSYHKFGNNILVNIHYFLQLSNINICQLIIYIVIISKSHPRRFQFLIKLISHNKYNKYNKETCEYKFE